MSELKEVGKVRHVGEVGEMGGSGDTVSKIGVVGGIKRGGKCGGGRGDLRDEGSRRGGELGEAGR